MRSYPQNSPEAAARIIAMMMLADGHLCLSELTSLSHSPARESLGVTPAILIDVTRDFCQDIQACEKSQWSNASCLDKGTVRSFMAEFDDPSLRQKLLELCASVVEADRHVSEGESLLLDAAVNCWGVQPERLLQST
ncbi:MAG: TerB family tellurite resistance protein [Burkholderiaceae bacterium]